MSETIKLVFIGGGNMSQAILGGLIAKGQAPSDCLVIDPFEPALKKLAEWGVPTAAELDDIAMDTVLAATAIVLAVKPQMMKAALAPLAGKLKHQLVISIAAGVCIESMAHWLGTVQQPYEQIIRAMPNTPALIQAGITGLYAPSSVSAVERAIAENLLGAVGKTVWFESEDMLNAVTAVSGSGPAYVFYFIEALEAAAIELGFSADAARLFAQETFLGSAKLAAQSLDSPASLRAKVTSKGGTTERAIEHFDSDALRFSLKSGFIDGVKAACARSRELGLALKNE